MKTEIFTILKKLSSTFILSSLFYVYNHIYNSDRCLASLFEQNVISITQMLSTQHLCEMLTVICEEQLFAKNCKFLKPKQLKYENIFFYNFYLT